MILTIIAQFEAVEIVLAPALVDKRNVCVCTCVWRSRCVLVEYAVVRMER